MQLAEIFDVAVIGAGPAGLAAAGEAASAGVSVVLIDAATQPGGQYWRHADERHETGEPGRWHHGWKTYESLARELRVHIDDGAIEYCPSTHVVSVENGGPFTLQTAPVQEAAGSRSGLTSISARRVVLCPGTYDRQLPVPGWTIPGVMAAGGVQAFIKTQGISPGRRVVLGGTGPFLLAAAASILEAGGEVAAICESSDLAGWIPQGALAGLVPAKAVEGAEYAALLARHRVPYLRRTVITNIHGGKSVEAVATAKITRAGSIRPGTEQAFENVDIVGLGWGFVPQVELVLQFGAETLQDGDSSLVGVVDGDQQSSIPGLFLAGEITGVSGATAAVAEGRIAGRAVARSAIKRPLAATVRVADARDRITRRNHRAFARAMHQAHRVPATWSQWLKEDTLVCRCEEVSWHTVCEATENLAAEDPRTLKGVTRLGMGWCQGRICGFAAACLSGAKTTSSSQRTLAVPVSTADLAAPKN